jgi:hypothetical protein
MTWLPASPALAKPRPKSSTEQIINKSTLCTASTIFITFLHSVGSCSGTSGRG